MTDLSTTIAPKSDQLNADDLLAGPMTITITDVTYGAGPEQPINVSYEGDGGRPYKPCKSMRRVFVSAWGKDGSKYRGRRVTIYRDPEVRFGKDKVGGIRISHMSHLEETMELALTNARGSRKPYIVKPLQAVEPAEQLSTEAVTQRLRAAAGQGTAALETEWRRRTTAPYREQLGALLDELKGTAAAARQPEPAGGDYDGA